MTPVPARRAFDPDEHTLPPFVESKIGLRQATVLRASTRNGLVQTTHAQDGGGEVVEHGERVGLVLTQQGWGQRQGHVGVVGGDEGDGGVGEEAGEEGC